MIWLLPLFLQGGLMAVDEFYFHAKRGLSRWERVGHPLDTVFFLACCFIAYLPQASENIQPEYLGCAIFSCLIITKDEWIHRDVCTGLENWLHSLLFILHPVALLAIWQLRQNQRFDLLQIQAALVSLFLAFQIIYWNAAGQNFWKKLSFK